MNREPIYLNADVIAILNTLVKAQNEGKCEIFFELYGHVEKLSIKVHAPRWSARHDPSFKEEISLTRTEDISNTIKSIKEAKDRITSYLDSLPVPQVFLTSNT